MTLILCILCTEFTGKERDTESGNHYFGARYYGNSMGRWMRPDPSPAGIDVRNPQSWNLYNYVLNNPLRLVDRNGMWATDIHAQIVTYALQNYVSAGELNTLRARQYSMDADQAIKITMPWLIKDSLRKGHWTQCGALWLRICQLYRVRRTRTVRLMAQA